MENSEEQRIIEVYVVRDKADGGGAGRSEGRASVDSGGC